jgi:hypothetical protein
MLQLTKNLFCGDVILEPEEIFEIAENKGSIYFSWHKKIYPAAFVLNMNFNVIFKAIKNRDLYTVKKVTKNLHLDYKH